MRRRLRVTNPKRKSKTIKAIDKRTGQLIKVGLGVATASLAIGSINSLTSKLD